MNTRKGKLIPVTGIPNIKGHVNYTDPGLSH